MRRLQRTALVWRFENEMAPACSNFLPVGREHLVDRKIFVSRIEMSLFRDRATMGVWLVVKNVFNSSRGYKFWLQDMFAYLRSEGLYFIEQNEDGDHTSEEERGFHQEPPVRINGSNARLGFEFERINGEAFTDTAIKLFYRFIDTLDVPESWHYFLPHPTVYQETMVRDPNDGWVPFGYHLAEKHSLVTSEHERRMQATMESARAGG